MAAFMFAKAGQARFREWTRTTEQEASPPFPGIFQPAEWLMFCSWPFRDIQLPEPEEQVPEMMLTKNGTGMPHIRI